MITNENNESSVFHGISNNCSRVVPENFSRKCTSRTLAINLYDLNIFRFCGFLLAFSNFGSNRLSIYVFYTCTGFPVAVFLFVFFFFIHIPMSYTILFNRFYVVFGRGGVVRVFRPCNID